MSDTVLVLNAGSSSIKFELFAVAGDDLERRVKGLFEGIGTRPRLQAADAAGAQLQARDFDAREIPGHPEAIAVLGGWLCEYLAGRYPLAVGHRVVHGGPHLDKPVLIDDDILAALEDLVPLAPLHQPANLGPIRAVRTQMPQVPQVACFDTAFHREHGELADRFAIPDSYYRAGVRRYGFHGLSYEYIASVLPEVAPELAQGRAIVAHLGNGASLAALHRGHSVDSTMGFTALDGLPMGTRPGALDPGVVLYLIAQRGMTPSEVERLLYHDCGLKGLSGISNDVRDLVASDDPQAALALDFFAFRAAKEIGALTSVLGGLDGIVFTAGIGENAPEVRKNICDRLGWLDVRLDEDANARGAPRISQAGTRPVYIVPTDEERMIARHTLGCLRAAAAT